ncbi:MAG: oligopeptide/dipeptide ABC transporter ATP-binding protein [Eubacteriales bacterium]|nr:oligopeptide/dipeptide ABC transporter ATP-binding protein [Eubacteriales bacterium]
MQKQEAMISVRNLKMYFPVGGSLFEKKKTLKAVDDVSFDLYPGETFGLVGESGCGKTTVGRTIVRLYQPTAGQILLNGTDIAPLNEKEVLPYRSRMQMIFQDPYASLNPRMTVASIVGEPLRYQGMSAKEINDRVRELVECVGLKEDHLSRYPHEFSGGQRQRIGIARALASKPDFIVCDEPISALDVSIQAQIINMLEELQARFGMTYLFVSHDLSMVRHISKRVAVMYLGHIVEMAPVNELYANMLHPYTKALMSAVPIADPDAAEKSKRIVLQGDVPQPINPPSGCPFRTRCPYADKGCAEQIPELKDMGGGHMVACHKV